MAEDKLAANLPLVQIFLQWHGLLPAYQRCRLQAEVLLPPYYAAGMN